MRDNNFRKDLRKSAVAAALTAALAFGGPVGCTQMPQTPPIEQLAKNDNNLNALGFRGREDYEEYVAIKNSLSNANISPEEIQALNERLWKLMLGVGKEKVIAWEFSRNSEVTEAQCLPDRVEVIESSPDQIRLFYMPEVNDGKTSAKVVLVNPDSVPTLNGYGNNDQVYSCDERLGNYIREIAKLQTPGGPDRKKQLESALALFEEFTVYKLEENDGTIKTEKDPAIARRIDDLNKVNNKDR